jgi:hypothetical protein
MRCSVRRCQFPDALLGALLRRYQVAHSRLQFGEIARLDQSIVRLSDHLRKHGRLLGLEGAF